MADICPAINHEGTSLRAEALAAGGEGFVAWDEERRTAVRYDPTTREYELPPIRLTLSGACVVAGRDGPIACRTAFALFAVQCRAMSPETAAKISGVDADAIREAARVLWRHRPVAHYTWTGLEQQSNATQTDRAIAILRALTGRIDAAGGNLQLAQVPVNDVSGNELREATQWRKALGLAERPLGAGARSVDNGCSREVRSIGRRSGAALRWGFAPARRPTPAH